MSLTIEFTPRVHSRLCLWAEMPDVPNELAVPLFVSILILDLLGLDYRHKDSPYYLPRPEMDLPSEAERMTNDLVHGFIRIQEQNRAAITEAITKRNRLAADVDLLERAVSRMEHEATDALRDGNREHAKQLLKDKALRELELQARRTELTVAEAAIEAVKQHIQQAEEQFKNNAIELTSKYPETMAEAERPVFTAELIATFDRLSLPQNAAGTEPSRIDTAEESTGRRVDEQGIVTMANVVPEKSVELPADTGPLLMTLEFSPESESLIESQARERGFSAAEYLTAIAEQLIDLADLVTPLNMPQKRDTDDFQSTPIEEILHEAVLEMKENQIKNREYAVKAITQKNNLQAKVDKEARIVAAYERKALTALDDGSRNLAEQLYQESRRHVQTLEVMRGLLAQATDLADKVKAQIKREEERIRVRTSKALLLKANLAASAIAFRLDTLREETLPSDSEEVQQDFEMWIQARKQFNADEA